MEFPQISLSDWMTTVLDKLVSAFASKDFHQNNPLLQFDDNIMLAIKIVAGILHRIVSKPSLPQPLQHKSLPIPGHTVPAPRVLQPTIIIPTHVIPVPRVLQTITRHPHTIIKERS